MSDIRATEETLLLETQARDWRRSTPSSPLLPHSNFLPLPPMDQT